MSIGVPSNSTKSLVGNNLSISNLPPQEDLIIVMTGNGSRKVAANYGEIFPNPTESEYKLVISEKGEK